MKKCSYCGKENSNEATTCVECGSTELAMIASDSSSAPRPSTLDTESAEPWDKIAVVENEAEAERLDVELSNLNIPHVMRSYHDSALDGIYQFSHGWGEVEAPKERREEILSILNDIRSAKSDADA